MVPSLDAPASRRLFWLRRRRQIEPPPRPLRHLRGPLHEVRDRLRLRVAPRPAGGVAAPPRPVAARPLVRQRLRQVIKGGGLLFHGHGRYSVEAVHVSCRRTAASSGSAPFSSS